MAKCAACGKDMLKVDRCAYETPLLMAAPLPGGGDGDYGPPRTVRRVPYGGETNFTDAAGEHCHDCRVVKGHLHHPGCDQEECPLCHGQLFACDCMVMDPGEA
jgi:hypothetical protein